MYALIPLNDSPDAYQRLRHVLVGNQVTDGAPELVTITDDGNIVRMEAAADFYTEQLAQQPAMAGLAIRPWHELPSAAREAFAADLGRHVEWLFPDSGPLCYQPADDILDIITAS